MRRADLCRCEKSRLNRSASPVKVSPYCVEAEGEVPFDVLEDDEERVDLFDDPEDIGPEVALVFFAEPLPGLAEGLAWIAGNDAMNSATPRAAVEGGDIAPQRRRSQKLLFHRRNQMGAGECVSLNETDADSAWNRQSDTEIESSASGAEGDDPEVGTKIHMRKRLHWLRHGDTIHCRTRSPAS